MSKLLVKGGNLLSGEYTVKAAKNAVLPIIAASLLTDERCEITNVPDILDIRNMIKIMREIGSDVSFVDGVITIQNCNIKKYSISVELAKELRSSIFLLGSIIGRMRKAVVAYPGGCDIGVRPLDIHIKSLQELGVAIEESHGLIYCDATSLAGSNIVLDFPSVGATENIMMAAVFAKGKTCIKNPAKEPEIVDLQNFINAMGGNIRGAGEDVIEIEGVKRLHGVTYKPIPDRIVAGTLLIGNVICGGELTINQCVPSHLEPLLFKLSKSSCLLRVESDKIKIKSYAQIKNIDKLETQPYPGFPTDLQSPMMALMSVSEGTGIIVENIFETRFKPVRELLKMGARIMVKDRMAIIRGVNRLEGANVCAGDLRGGVALVLAAMKADGYSYIDGLNHIDRGYEYVENIMNSLGANIKRIL